MKKTLGIIMQTVCVHSREPSEQAEASLSLKILENPMDMLGQGRPPQSGAHIRAHSLHAH